MQGSLGGSRLDTALGEGMRTREDEKWEKKKMAKGERESRRSRKSQEDI